jgi:hypothetical protein
LTIGFVVQPGDAASCSFTISVEQVGKGSFHVLLSASGQPVSAIVHSERLGTGSANGKIVIEHAAQTDLLDLVAGTSVTVGGITDQVPHGGVLIHDVGILRFDPAGSATFKAGPHNGFDGDPVAVAALCAALSQWSRPAEFLRLKVSRVRIRERWRIHGPGSSSHRRGVDHGFDR